MPDPSPASVHADCLNEIVVAVKALGLIGITAIGTQAVVSDVGSLTDATGASPVVTAITGDDGNLAGSFISVSPWMQEDLGDFTNSRDMISYKCLIAIIAKRDDPELARKLEWRELIRKKLHNLRIDVATVRQTKLQMNPVVEPSLYLKKQVYFSSMVLLCNSYEVRG